MRQAFVRRLKQMGYDRHSANRIYNAILESMREIFLEEGELILKGLFILKVWKTKGRFIRVPRTGIECFISPAYISIRAGKRLKRRLSLEKGAYQESVSENGHRQKTSKKTPLSFL
ncbi:MAG: HU family DNA-binding protein [Aquificaceae bacterium]